VSKFPWKWDPRFVLTLRELLLAIRKQKPQVLHIQESVDFRLYVIVQLLRSIPLVLTVHDPVLHLGEQNAYSKCEIVLRNKLRRTANCIIVHSDALRGDLLRYDPALAQSSIHIVPHGAYTLFRQWLDPNDLAPKRKPSVLFFGRMHEYKGIDVLIQAATLVVKAIPGARFVLAGEGPALVKYKSEIDALACFEVHEGYIPNEFVPKLFQTADIVVLPYKEASQSGVAAIALALGKPIVATHVGGLPEIVENEINGFLVPPGDAIKLADAIIRLLSDVNLQRQIVP
jgi:glycosyltransferase involved in cell wall biosynthesis